MPLSLTPCGGSPTAFMDSWIFFISPNSGESRKSKSITVVLFLPLSLKVYEMREESCSGSSRSCQSRPVISG